jgi:hypothetical protein
MAKVPKRVRGPFTPGQLVEHKVRGELRITRAEAVKLNSEWFSLAVQRMRAEYEAKGVPPNRQRYPESVVTLYSGDL